MDGSTRAQQSATSASGRKRIAWFRRSIEASWNFPLSHFELAAALAQLGRQDEARSAVKAGLALNPTFSISRARAYYAARTRNIWPSLGAFSKACAWPGCPRNNLAKVVGYSRLMGEDEAGDGVERRANVPTGALGRLTIDAALANGRYPPIGDIRAALLR